MNHSLEQYLKLYKENRALLAGISSETLMNCRDEFFCLLQNAELPDKSWEGYQKTSINDMFAPDLGVNLLGKDLIEGTKRLSCGIDSIKAIKIIVHNDILVGIHLPKDMTSLPKGLKISNLKDVENQREHFDRFFQHIREKHDAAIYLNALLGVDGVFITVDDNCIIDTPVQIINYAGAPVSMISNRKVYVGLGIKSSLNILICDHSINPDDKNINLINGFTDIELDKGSKLSFVEMEETNPVNRRFSNLIVNQKENSEAVISSITLMNGTTRNNFYINSEGNHTVTTVNGLEIAKNRSHIDNMTHIRHKADSCKSDQLFKYALYDNASGAFEGRITVEKDARFNEAFQNNRNIIANEGAKMYSMPQLLIYNDDVKCSHGATTGQLDANALYYMRTRGIPLAVAKSMLMQAFMNDIIQKIGFPSLQERLYHLIERRLNGEDILCGACKFKD